MHPELGAALVAANQTALASANQPGSIAGDVRVEVRSSMRLANPGAYQTRQVTIAPQHEGSELENVVIFVKAPGHVAATPVRAVIRQQDATFVPHVVAVTTGSSVEFPNDDVIFHSVFSLSRTASFDLGRYKRGESRVRTFDTPGIVKVHCHLHSHMSAVVLVFDHPHFTQPDAAGRFALAGLPPGRHDVVAWHERVGEVTRQVTVRAGETTTVGFSLPMKDAS